MQRDASLFLRFISFNFLIMFYRCLGMAKFSLPSASILLVQILVKGGASIKEEVCNNF